MRHVFRVGHTLRCPPDLETPLVFLDRVDTPSSWSAGDTATANVTLERNPEFGSFDPLPSLAPTP